MIASTAYAVNVSVPQSTAYGQVLIGNATGGSYTPVATSTLGISGGGSGVGTVSTSSQETAGQLGAWGTTNGYPAKLYSVATTSATCSSGVSCGAHTVIGSSPVSFTNTGLLSLQQLGGGAAQTGAITFSTSTTAINNDWGITNSSGAFTFNLPTATSAVRGLLSAADWVTFNSKLSSLTPWTTNIDGGGFNLNDVGTTSSAFFNATSSGTVQNPSISVGVPVNKVGIYLAAASTLGLTNGVSGLSWNGTAFYPNSANLRDLGIQALNNWNELYVTIASSTSSIISGLGTPAGTFLAAGPNGNIIATTSPQPAGNYITALTGDATASGPGSAALTLATVNANVGSFTNANITVNAKGLITAAANGSGGSGTPGGASSTLQYNANGAFGGIVNVFTDGTSLGVGTTTPNKPFMVEGATAGGVARIQRDATSPLLNAIYGTYDVILNQASTTLANLTGPAQTFGVSLNGGAENIYGDISVLRESADNSGAMQLRTYNAGVAATAIYMDHLQNVGIGSTTPFDKLSLVGNLQQYGAYAHFGTAAPLYPEVAQSAIGLWGNDNTTNGVQLSVGNTNAGASAYSGINLLSSDANSNLTNFAGIYKNSPYYSDVTFGTGVNSPNQMLVQNTLGAITSVVSTTSPASAFFNWLTNGTASTNEVMRLTSTGFLGIGSTTPWAKLSVNANALGAGVPQFVVGSSTATNFVVSNAGFVGVATSTPTNPFEVLGGSYFQGTMRIISGNALAFSVGNTGTTSNAFAVDNGSGISAGTGILITSAGPGTAPNISVTSPANNEGLFVSSKGTGNITFRTGATARLTVTQSQALFANTVNSSTANNIRFSVPDGNDTGLNAGVNAIHTFFNLGAQSRTHAIGAMALQTDFVVTGTSHTFASFNAGANIITDLAAVQFNGNNIGANALATNAETLEITSTTYNASTTNAYGLTINGPTGATNNYAASTTGRWTMNSLTASSGLQTGVVCLSSAFELINDSVACLASARRFKENITPIIDDSSLAQILAMEPQTYLYKPDFNGSRQSDPNYNRTQVGLIADDVQKINPAFGLVTTATTSFEGVTYAPGTIKGIDYDSITATLVGAVKAQQKQIDAIKTGTNKAVRSVEENYQWALIGFLMFMFLYQQWQINRLKDEL